MLGDAIYNGIQGYRQAENDNAVREEREYRNQKRVADDAYTAEQRERNGVIWGREDEKYEAEKAKSERLTALRDTWDAYAKSKVTGDLSGLTSYMKAYDNRDGADIQDVQYGDKGKLNILYDSGDEYSINEDQFVQMMRMQFSPENWMNLQREKELQDHTTGNTMTVNKANVDNQNSINDNSAANTMEVNEANVGNQNSVNNNSAANTMEINEESNNLAIGRDAAQQTLENGLGAPEAIKYTDEDGRVYTRLYKNQHEYEVVGGAPDPALVKANKTNTDGSGGKPTDYQVANFFKSFSEKAFGSEGAGGILIPKGSRMNAASVAELGNYIYKNKGGTLNSSAAKALRFVEKYPTLTKTQAMKKLKELGKKGTTLFSSDKEEEEYQKMVSTLIEQSKDPLTYGIKPTSNGVNLQSNKSTSQAGTIQGGDPLGIR